jgi:hypothetical protein
MSLNFQGLEKIARWKKMLDGAEKTASELLPTDAL